MSIPRRTQKKKKKHTHTHTLAIKQLSRKLEPPQVTNNKIAPPTSNSGSVLARIYGEKSTWRLFLLNRVLGDTEGFSTVFMNHFFYYLENHV